MTIFAHAPYVGNSGYNSHCQNFFRKLSEYQKLKIRNFTVGKNWQASNSSSQEPHGKDIDQLDKSLIGLQTLWNTKGDLEDFEIHGFKKSEFNYDVNIVLSEVNHYYFYQNYKGPKIAYTVWENTLYPDQFFNKLKEYDQVWVPTKWQANITINQGIAAEKVKVVPEGVDVDLFKPRNLNTQGQIFRFVLFGRWDARKSTREIIQAFKNVFGNNKNVELWISVDNPYSVDGLNSTEERLKKHNLECENIKILHFPSRQEYVDILSSSHVFISCARSEGWNLPLIEAMACGIPSIYSDCSGQLEFAEGKGIPVKIAKEISPKEIKNSYCEMVDVAAGNWYEPDFKDLEDKILYCFNNYAQLKQKALKDSEEIREKFTWNNAAKKASNILEDFIKHYYKQDYIVEFHGLTEDKKGIVYRSSTEKSQKVITQIVDEFSGFVFYEKELEIHNKCFFFTKHAYELPNQIFKVYDYYTKELKLEYKINQDLHYNLEDLKQENQNLISLIPESISNCPFLGFSFLEIFHRKTYNFKLCKIEKGDIVFDLGSCFGLFSRYAFLNGASEVHAFEPNKELIDSNISLNKGFNFNFNNKAVHSKNVQFIKNHDYIGSLTQEVQYENNLSININSYIKQNNIKKIDYLKIDIEGAEYDFFDHIDKVFLANNINKIALEYHFNSNRKIDHIVALLKSCGFVCEFEYSEFQDKELGMLYAWKKQGFDFEKFFAKYRESIEKSGISRVRFYEYIIPKLVSKNKPLYILETGTMWAPLKDNMGAFTLIMSDLIKNFTGGKLYTVDISEKNLNSCKEYTKDFASHIEYIQSDSVSFIANSSDDFIFDLDLVYLDSWDLNVPKPHDSANHHLKELMALYYRINNDCPIAIDDNFLPNTFIMWNYYDLNGNIINTERFETYDKILGKGMYCHEFLIKNNWQRFQKFDVLGANNLFYYERQKLTLKQVKNILNNFYSKNKINLPPPKSFEHIKNITNEPRGLGDALILTSLAPEKNIYSKFNEFFSLLNYTDCNFKQQNNYFDIYNSDLHKYDWGGGHCIQRLQKAFLGKCDSLPKPKLNKKYSPIKNKVAIHFESNKRKETALPENIRQLIKQFLKNENYEIYDCSLAQNIKELIDEMSTCEYFIGIDSGPMHVAAAFETKSIVILNHPSAKNTYLPKIEEADIANSEWLYPQNIHLSINEGNELIEKFSINNLRNAMLGNLYPYFSLEYINNEENFKWSFEKNSNKLNFSFNKDYKNARIILKESNKNLKCFDWDIGKINKNINYYIIPTSNINLMEIDFEGFIFSLYENDLLIFEKTLIIKNIQEKSKVKYFSNKFLDLNIYDSFYVQYSDFYINNFIKDCVSNKNVIIDIGASCGSFVDICLQNNVSKIIALEPSASFEILKNTFAKNDNVICLNKALSTDCQSKEIYFTNYTTLTSFEMQKQKTFDSANLIKNTIPKIIDCIDLKNLKQNLNLQEINLLKIDIEGFEYELFNCFNYKDLENVDEILLEYHHNENKKIDSIIKKLKSFGFNVFLKNLSYIDNLSLDNLQGVLYAKRSNAVLNVINESGSLGDFLAWTPMVSKYAKLNKVKINYYTPYKNLLQESYPEINFYDYQEKNNINTSKVIKLGIFEGYVYQDKGLQQIACDLLNIPFEEEICKLPKKFKKQNNFKKKYVCIAIQSTSQCKYWNNKEGWQKTIDYLNSLGYEVVCLDKYSSFGSQSHMNLMPRNCINKTGDLPLEDRINDLFHCDFFIGLSSGLAWLAWACEKPVVMISGFTDVFNEFSNPYRIINKNVCNSCWNDASLKFDMQNWLWCPRNKDFECSKQITFDMVKDKIDSIIKDN